MNSYTYYIYTRMEIQVDGGELDDLERVISTKDSLQNHLSLATHINHTSAQSSWRWRWIFRGGIYITVAAAAARVVYIYVCVCVCVCVRVTSIKSAGEEIF
jgi:hypothetical protein